MLFIHCISIGICRCGLIKAAFTSPSNSCRLRLQNVIVVEEIMSATLAFSILFLVAALVVTDGAKIDEEFSSMLEESYLLNIENPTDIEFSPDGSMLLVTDKTGPVYFVENFQDDDGNLKKTEIFNIASRMCTNGERGLGSIAFHPNFPSKPYVYIHYNFDKYNDCYNGLNERGLNRGPVNRLSRFVMDLTTKRIDKKTERVLLESPRQPVHNHNGGDIAFGKDGLLYATIGDGGTRTWKNDDGIPYSQALDNLFGTVVRLTEDGEIPKDNPFTPSQGYQDSVRCGDTEGAAPKSSIKCQEIYNYGLRNPFRFTFDPDADRFFINDVGSTTWERILSGEKGANYGYPLQDGPCLKKAKTCEPNEFSKNDVHWYLHDDEDGGCITGGAFISNRYGWPESLNGSYIYSEYAQRGIHVMTQSSQQACLYPQCDPPRSSFNTRVLSLNEKVVAMQFGPFIGIHALYYVTKGQDGNKRKTAGLYRIAMTGTNNRSPVAVVDADVTFGFSPLRVTFDASKSKDPDGDDITFEWDFNGDSEIDSSQPSASYTYRSAGTYTATLTVKDGRGGKGTKVLTIEVGSTPPTPVILSPREGLKFAVGDVFILEGYAEDNEDGTLPEDSLEWEVRQHHNSHWHPFLDPTEGRKQIELDPAPEPEDFDASTTSYLEILLTATDSTGLSTTTSRVIMPKMIRIDFDTIPSGLKVVAYGDTVVTPATITTWENHVFEVEAPERATIDSNEYFSFASWSDSGDRIHRYAAIPSDYAAIPYDYAEGRGEELLSQTLALVAIFERENFPSPTTNSEAPVGRLSGDMNEQNGSSDAKEKFEEEEKDADQQEPDEVMVGG